MINSYVKFDVIWKNGSAFKCRFIDFILLQTYNTIFFLLCQNAHPVL